MWIKNITITNCRLLESLSLSFSEKLNIIIGPNASGKTSILEALNILSKGRSFRTSHINDVISHKKESIIISANVIESDDSSQIGIEKTTKKTKIRINKQDVYSQAELSAHIPITVIHPNSIDLVTGSPSNRRAYLDWLAFYLFSDFHSKWKKYQHILKQRNSCLKFAKHEYALDKWTEELVELQPEIIDYRTEVIKNLQPKITEISSVLLNGINIELRFNNGFPKEVPIEKAALIEYYRSKIEYDKKLKRTNAGSHRADFSILMNGIPAIETASRGQLKLLAICLLLAQNDCIEDSKTGSGILIIDDLAAELDTENKSRLLMYLATLNKQLIITSTHKMEIPGIQAKMFHVKHGLLCKK